MNEKLLRQLIRECLIAGEVPQLLKEENFVAKHFADSAYATGRPRPRYYLQWLKDGSPEPDPTAEKPPPYDPYIEAFKKKGDEAFNVDAGGRFWYIDDQGTMSMSSFEDSQNVKPLTYTKVDASAHAQEANSVDPNVTQTSKESFRGGVALKIELTSIPSHLGEPSKKPEAPPVPAHNGDRIAYVLLGDNVLNHTLSVGGAKGTLSDQILGQAVENAVAIGLSGKPRKQAIADARADKRIGSALVNASEAEVQDFDEIIGNAWKQASMIRDEIGITKAELDKSNTGKVDVHGDTNTNGKADLHVKFNDPKRLFGLQGIKDVKDEETGEVTGQVGSQGTEQYKAKRNELVLQALPTVSSYIEWWNAKRKSLGGVVDEAEMVPTKDSKNPTGPPDEMFLKALNKGTKEISSAMVPITSKNPKGDFLDPRSLMRGYHGRGKAISSAIASLLSAQDDKKTWLESNFADAVVSLVDDIKTQIAGEDGREVHYLNFTLTGTKVTLDTTSFMFKDPEKMKVSVAVSESPRMGRAFEVTVDDGAGNLYNPFFIEMTSIARGHPLQVHKTTKASSAPPMDAMGDLSDLINPQPGSGEEQTVQNSSRKRPGNIIREEKMNNQNEKVLRALVREMLTEVFTKTDEDRIGVLTRKELDAAWKKDREKKVQAMIDKSTKNAYRNDDFYKVVGKIWKELMKVYAEEQFQHARRFTRYDVPLARIRP